MDKLVELAQTLVDHQKACKTCTNQHVCDEAAEINLKMVETAIFG